MLGYLKFEENDEELYEIDMQNQKEKTKTLVNNLISYFINCYLKLVVKIKKAFGIITVKEIYSGLIFILPIKLETVSKINNFKNKMSPKCLRSKLKKCIPKVKKLMKKYDITSIVISEELQKNKEFLEIFQNKRILEKDVHILEGKMLMKYLIREIVEYKAGATQLEDLYILAKQDLTEYKENISYLSEYFKTINIVTPCVKSYKIFAERLIEKQDAMITVTNNKRKSLRKAKWIVNFDMQADEMKNYTIYQNAAIIYLENGEVYNEVSFSGIHICKAGIDVSNEVKEFFEKQYLLNQCSITVLYESTIKKKNFKAVKEQMKKDCVKIAKLHD